MSPAILRAEEKTGLERCHFQQRRIVDVVHLLDDWRSQTSVDTISAVRSLELLGTDTADVAMTTGAIVERVDVIRHVG